MGGPGRAVGHRFPAAPSPRVRRARAGLGLIVRHRGVRRRVNSAVKCSTTSSTDAVRSPLIHSSKTSTTPPIKNRAVSTGSSRSRTPLPASDIALSAVSWASACRVSCRIRSSRSLTPTTSSATIRALRRSPVTVVQAARSVARAWFSMVVSPWASLDRLGEDVGHDALVDVVQEVFPAAERLVEVPGVERGSRADGADRGMGVPDRAEQFEPGFHQPFAPLGLALRWRDAPVRPGGFHTRFYRPDGSSCTPAPPARGLAGRESAQASPAARAAKRAPRQSGMAVLQFPPEKRCQSATFSFPGRSWPAGRAVSGGARCPGSAPGHHRARGGGPAGGGHTASPFPHRHCPGRAAAGLSRKAPAAGRFRYLQIVVDPASFRFAEAT